MCVLCIDVMSHFVLYVFPVGKKKNSNTKFRKAYLSETVTAWCTVNTTFIHWYNFRFDAYF